MPLKVHGRDIVGSYLEIMGIKVGGINDYGYRCYCPFHQDKDPSFSISRRTGYWKCWAYCGSGNFYTLLRRMGVDTRGLKLKLAPGKYKPPSKPRPEEGEIMYYAMHQSPHMVIRGFGSGVTDRFQIGWKEETRETIFPIRNPDGILIAYLHSPGPGKYYYTGDQRGEAFFGAQFIKGWEGPIILVEGPVDVLRVWQLARIPAIATMGSVSWGQKQWLKKHSSGFISMMDRDKAGIEHTRSIWKHLKKATSIHFVKWDGSEKDPGEVMSSQRMHTLLDNTTPFPIFST